MEVGGQEPKLLVKSPLHWRRILQNLNNQIGQDDLHEALRLAFGDNR